MRSALIVLASLVAPWARAGAQEEPECMPPEVPLEFTPASGGQAVALNAPVRVRYAPGDLDDPVLADAAMTGFRLYLCGASPCELAPSTNVVDGTPQIHGDSLFFVPSAPLAPFTWYSGSALLFDEVHGFSFRTGTFDDVAPPILDGLRAVEPAAHEGCAGQGYRLNVRFAPARDDGPLGDLEYLLYLTRGPEVTAPALRAHVRGYATDEIIMALVLDPAEAVSPVCLAVVTVDGVGRIDDDTPPLCLDPIQGNFFEPLCSAGAARDAVPAPWVALGIAATVWAGTRGRRRRSSRAADPR